MTTKLKLSFDVTNVEIAKRVTLPFIKQKVGIPAFVFFLEPYCKSAKMNKPAADGKPQLEEATLGHVINLVNGEESELILSTVTKSLLDEKYADNSYVGKAYQIQLFAVEGKKYHKVDMVEIKLADDDLKALKAEQGKIMGFGEVEATAAAEAAKVEDKPAELKKGK